MVNKNERPILSLRLEVNNFNSDLLVNGRIIDAGVADRFLVNVALLSPGQRLAPSSLPLISVKDILHNLRLFDWNLIE